ncbi:MarR family transcriptional regulator [Rhodococcus baikonurensis]
MWHLALRWRAGVDRAIAHLGLTHAQYSVLASLHGLVSVGRGPASGNSPRTQGCSESTYPSSCELWRRGFVVSERDDRDGRAVRLDLSDEGGRVIVLAKGIVRELDAENTRVLTEAGGRELAELHRALGALLDATEAGDE